MSTPEEERCADCGSAEIEDTWVIIDEETSEATEEPLCAKCSARRELIWFGSADKRNWTH